MESADFYFDYLSPYAYLASLRVEDVCEARGVAVRFQPVLFAGLLDHWGQRGPAEIAPKAAHTLRECLRYAALHGIPLRAPRYHPFRSLVPLRLTLAAPEAQRARVAHLLFDHGWGQGGDLGDADELVRVLEGAGLPGSEWQQLATTEPIKAALRASTERAIANDVFGIPTLCVRGEIFWGLDQLPHVERVLDGSDPLAGLDLASIRPRGRSAWRKQVPLDQGAAVGQVSYAALESPFSDATIAALEPLLFACFPDAEPQPRQLPWRRELRDPLLLWCATSGDRMIGFKLGRERSPGEFYSWLGGVHPDFRGRGVASALLERQHAHLSRAGYAMVTTEALADNAPMLRANLKHGFEVTGTRLDPRGLKVLMRKSLRDPQPPQSQPTESQPTKSRPTESSQG